MVGRIVEIADDRRHLFVHRGFMVVKDTEGERKELGQVPLDDIAAVIANAHGLTYTNNLLVALAERGAPFVLCGANHNAIGMLLTLDGHHVQAKRIEAQWAAALPLHKRLWAAVVKCKLEQQAAALEAAGAPTAPLQALVGKVKSGDPENIEGQGARHYWDCCLAQSFDAIRTAMASTHCSTMATPSCALLQHVPWWLRACIPASACTTAMTLTPCVWWMT